MNLEWEEKPLNQCLERFRVPAKIQKSQFSVNGEFPIISQEADFINGYWSNTQDVCRIDRPVIIFGDHTQVVKYVDFDFVVGADGVKVLKPKVFLEPKFLYYFLIAHRMPSLGYARHYRHIKEQIVKYPSMDEQRRIVMVLDEVFENIAHARTCTTVNLKDTKILLDSHLASVFSRGIGKWPVVSLQEIAQNLDRMRVPIAKKARILGDVPYYGASGVVDYVEDYLFDEDLLLVSEDGANLLTRTYPIAFSIRGKSWVNNHAHVLRFEEMYTQEFVRLYLNSISLEPYVNGMAQPKLNQTALHRIPIPLPDKVVRAEVVDKTRSISIEIDRLMQIYQATLNGLDDLCQSILKQAFLGELT